MAAGVWNRISDIYLREIDARFAPVVEALVGRAALRTGEQVLDLGTGTGTVAQRAAAIVGSSGRVVGVDISSEMLALARRIVTRLGLGNLTFLEGLVEGIDEQTLRRAEGVHRAAREPAGERDCIVTYALVVDDPRGEAEFQRALGEDRLVERGDLERAREADDPRQREARAAVDVDVHLVGAGYASLVAAARSRRLRGYPTAVQYSPKCSRTTSFSIV